MHRTGSGSNGNVSLMQPAADLERWEARQATEAVP